MKSIKRNIRILCVLLTISMLFASCHQSVEKVLNDSETNFVSNKFHERSSTEYSGEELFQSIFFGYGEFAEKINMYKPFIDQIEKIKDEDKQKFEEEYQKFTERFVSFAEKIREEEHDYFENFKTTIFGGDNIEIQNSVELGYDNIYENLEILLPEVLPLIESLQGDEDIIAMNDQENITQEDFSYLEDKYIDFLNNDLQISPNCTIAIPCFVAVASGVVVWLGIYWKRTLWGPKLDKPRLIEKNAMFDINDSELKFEIFIQDIINATHN